MKETPNFTGWHAALLHPEDSMTDRLVRQLKLLGCSVTQQWQPLAEDALPDIVLVDADQGWDGLLPWPRGTAPRPMVALLGSEAPGRIAWAIQQGAGAIIAKPLSVSAVYPALVMALDIHRERLAVAEKIQHLEERVRLRPLVHAAVQQIMAARKVDEHHAYNTLRSCAMKRRMAMEQMAASIVGGAEPMPEAV